MSEGCRGPGCFCFAPSLCTNPAPSPDLLWQALCKWPHSFCAFIALWPCQNVVSQGWPGTKQVGVLQTGQAAARQMVEQNKMQPGRGGCIINMSSVNAVMAIPTIAGYNASKGGVNNLTRSAPYVPSTLNMICFASTAYLQSLHHEQHTVTSPHTCPSLNSPSSDNG